MILSLRSVLFILISATVVFSAGCRKKPVRHDPTATMAGGGAGGGLNPGGLQDFTDGLFLDPNDAGLTARGAGEQGNQVRGVLQSVFFGFDQSAIAAAERPKLQEAARYLEANPTHRLLLEGHCDWRGTSEYNLGLGDRRARSAQQYLTTLGVDGGRLETLSKGDLEATENGSTEQMARDRRAELVVLTD